MDIKYHFRPLLSHFKLMKHVYYQCNAIAAHSIALGCVVAVTMGSQLLPRWVQNWLCGSRLGKQIVVSIDMAGILEIVNVGIQGTLHLLPHLVQPCSLKIRVILAILYDE
jgi:hypothetical protein